MSIRILQCFEQPCSPSIQLNASACRGCGIMFRELGINYGDVQSATSSQYQPHFRHDMNHLTAFCACKALIADHLLADVWTYSASKTSAAFLSSLTISVMTYPVDLNTELSYCLALMTSKLFHGSSRLSLATGIDAQSVPFRLILSQTELLEATWLA